MTVKVFLDTSVQVYRALADREQFVNIESQLISSDFNAITSQYVWMEYQRTVVADYAHIHRLMTEYNGWSELLRHLLDGSRSFRPRTAVRCTKIVSQIMEQSGDDWYLAYDRVEDQITDGLYLHFWDNVVPVSDPIVCDLVTNGINQQSDDCYSVASSCRKELATCHLPKFLNEHKAELSNVANYLSAHPKSIKDQPRLERLLAAILKDPQAVLGQSACWPLGDLIIALQVPPDAQVWSLDKDFATLAKILDIKRYPS